MARTHSHIVEGGKIVGCDCPYYKGESPPSQTQIIRSQMEEIAKLQKLVEQLKMERDNALKLASVNADLYMELYRKANS